MLVRRHLLPLTLAFTIAIPNGAPASVRQGRPVSTSGPWTIEYSLSGGLAFAVHSLKVTDQGELHAVDTRLGIKVAGRAHDQLLARLTAFLENAKVAAAARPMPDAISASLTVTRNGRTEELESTGDVRKALDAAWDGAVREALVGAWREAGWELCKPAAQLTAADVDPPIDDLEFHDDGTFEVTWRGGGARMYQPGPIPHTQIPDYRGRYSVTPASGGIRLQIENGIFVPHDFAGVGQFAISGDQLILTRVWFGTRQAKQKPDICKLTFTRP